MQLEPMGRAAFSRRRLLLGSACSVALGSAYIFKLEPEWLQVVRRTLPITNLPAGLTGRSLVQISDIHIGTRVSDSYVERCFRIVNDLRPDIVVYTGDFISYGPSIFGQAERLLRNAPLGHTATFGILGNHDYGPNWAHVDIAERLSEILARTGIRMLHNEIGEVDGLQIIGLDDLWADRFDVMKALRNYQPERPAITLSHNPDSVDLDGWDSFRGWILSGHTHGGQCKPPFLPPPLLPVQNRRYTAGAFELGNGRRLYVNRGVGHLTKVRFNVRPEVTRFVLERA